MVARRLSAKIIGFESREAAAKQRGRILNLRNIIEENPLIKEAVIDLMERKSFNEFANGTTLWKQHFAEEKVDARTAIGRMRAAHAFRTMDELSKVLNEMRKRRDLEKELRALRKKLIIP
jgi:hypothetical protein